MLLQKPNIWLVVGLWVLILGLGFTLHTYLSDKKPDVVLEAKILREGDTLPATAAFSTLEGKAVQFGDVKGKVTLLNFWAGWCAPCLQEMPGLYRLQEKWKDQGFVVVAVNLDDSPEEGVRVLKRITGEPAFPMYVGTESSLLAHFPIEGLPFTVILDESGKIRYARAGEVDWGSPAAQKLIGNML